MGAPPFCRIVEFEIVRNRLDLGWEPIAAHRAQQLRRQMRAPVVEPIKGRRDLVPISRALDQELADRPRVEAVQMLGAAPELEPIR
jgi:hypothetical protein